MRKQQTIKLETSEGEGEFVLTQIDGHTGAKLTFKIGELFGPVIAAGFANKNEMNLSNLGGAFSEACAKLNASEFDSLSGQLLNSCQCKIKGQFISVDKHFIEEYFAGCADSLMLLLWEALKLNFANFFKRGGGALAPFLAKIQPPQSQQNS